MQKFKASFFDSFGEFKHVRSITVAALFAAVSVVLGYFTIAIGNFIKIGFSTIANQMVYYLFGPVFGAFYGGALDILKFMIKPTGQFFPGFTFSAMLAGLLYGMFLYRKPLSLKRVLIAELTVIVICNMLLGTYWLTIMYGRAFMAIFPLRALKNLIMWPINSLLFFGIARTLEASGIFRAMREKK